MISKKGTQARFELCMLFGIGIFLNLYACSSAKGSSDSGESNTTRENVIAGTPATNFPEAALVDVFQDNVLLSRCSGVIIAPRVTLTAGHCIQTSGANKWKITAPYANSQPSITSSAWTNYVSTDSSRLNPRSQDVGLVFLDCPIQLPMYPHIASTPVSDGTLVLTLGRLQDTTLSMTDLFVSKPIVISNATLIGFPFDYQAMQNLASGDSGGPDMLQDSYHTIVAVNSGAGSSVEALSRVDLLYDWIQQQITAHGGLSTSAFQGGSCPVADNSSTGSASSSSPSTVAGAGGALGSNPGNPSGSPTAAGAGGGNLNANPNSNPNSSASCAHDLCLPGAELNPLCSPCVTQVCNAYPACCQSAWGAFCIGYAIPFCNLTCSAWIPQ